MKKLFGGLIVLLAIALAIAGCEGDTGGGKKSPPTTPAPIAEVTPVEDGFVITVMRPSSSAKPQSHNQGLGGPGTLSIAATSQFLELRATDSVAPVPNVYMAEIDFGVSSPDCGVIAPDVCSTVFAVPPETYALEIGAFEAVPADPFTEFLASAPSIGAVKLNDYGKMTGLVVCPEGDEACGDLDGDGHTAVNMTLSPASLAFSPEPTGPVFYGINKGLTVEATGFPDDVVSGGAIFLRLTDDADPVATVGVHCSNAGVGIGPVTYSCIGTAPGSSNSTISPPNSEGTNITFAVALSGGANWTFPGQVFAMQDSFVIVAPSVVFQSPSSFLDIIVQ